MAARVGMTFKVQRGKYQRTYRLDRIEMIENSDALQVVASPVFKNGKTGRARTVGVLVVTDQAA